MDEKIEKPTKDINIVVLTKTSFPYGSAASSYILNLCRAMASTNIKVSVFACRRNKDNNKSSGIIDGISYTNYDLYKKNKLSRILFDNYCWSHFVKRWLNNQSYDVIFLSGGTLPEARGINKLCKRKQINYGVINSEWYTPDCFPNGTSKKAIKSLVKLVPYNATCADLAIAISSTISNKYINSNVPSIFIPNIVDLQDEKWHNIIKPLENNKMILSYAGKPGVGKDELGTAIAALMRLPEDIKKHITFNIYGPSLKELKEYLKNDIGTEEYDNTMIICHGEVNQNDIPHLIGAGHYTILIRKPSLRTNAGFSTKMVESFAAGIPLIANITGDMGNYLIDMENGIIVEDYSVEACEKALIRAYNNLVNNEKMRVKAFDTAKKYFDYRNYSRELNEFINNQI